MVTTCKARRGLKAMTPLSSWIADPTLTAKFWLKFHRTASGCWTWTDALSSGGYGHLCKPGGSVGAHRFAYELLVGPIPEGLVIDHLCRNRACVNPDHLEPVTNAENLRRGVSFSAVNARKVTCGQGHALDGANLFVEFGRRGCVKCRNARRAARNLTRRIQRAEVHVGLDAWGLRPVSIAEAFEAAEAI